MLPADCADQVFKRTQVTSRKKIRLFEIVQHAVETAGVLGYLRLFDGGGGCGTKAGADPSRKARAQLHDGHATHEEGSKQRLLTADVDPIAYFS